MTSHASQKKWQISLFGALTIVSPTGTVYRTDRPKAMELLAFLALRRTPVVDRDTVTAALWPDVDFNAGRNRLKQTLAVLRKEMPEIPIAVHGKNAFELDRAAVEIDAETVDGRMKWINALQPHERADAARQMWETVRQGLLPELKAAWAFPEQARIEELSARLLRLSEGSGFGARATFRFGDRFGGANVALAGRSQEMRFIQEWLSLPHRRSLRLVGPPGVGKTRLLHEAASPERNLCDAIIMLSTVQSSEAPWLERIGQIIGVRGAQEVTDSLVRLLLGFNRPLITIDDFDQAGDEMRDWVAQVSLLVPQLKVVGTARRREPNVADEYLEVNPLNTDESTNTDARDLLVSFAAHFGVPAHQLEQNSEVLKEIARKLEGLPLALEVAAGWLPYMQPSRLLTQLSESMNLVIERSAEHHDSLRECVRVITSSIPEQERAALRSFSICRAGYGEEFAERLFGTSWAWRVRALRERSLLFRVDGKSGNRFVALQAIRQSVISIEESELIEAALDHHQSAGLILAERAAWEISEGDRATWLNFMRDESDNILLACTRNLQDDATLNRAIGLLHLLRSAFHMIRRVSEFSRVFQDLCERALARYPDCDHTTPMAAIRYRVRALIENGDVHLAARLATRYRESTEAENRAPFELADAFDLEGECLYRLEDFHGTLRCATEASRYFSQAGYARHALWMEPKCVSCEHALGRHEDARARRLRALDRAIQINDFNSVGSYKKRFARLAYIDGRWEEAVCLAKESIEAFVQAGESMTTFVAYLVLAAAYLAGGDRKSALAALNESSEFVSLADPGSLPSYNLLLDAAMHGTPIDLKQIDYHPVA